MVDGRRSTDDRSPKCFRGCETTSESFRFVLDPVLGLRTVCGTTMPYAAIHTNQTLPKEKQMLLLGVVSDLVASQLGKPKQYVMASIVEGLPMVFAGDDSPAAFLELSSIGVPDEKREPLCARLTERISAHTAIPPERIYIVLTDVSRRLWAQGGKTFG